MEGERGGGLGSFQYSGEGIASACSSNVSTFLAVRSSHVGYPKQDYYGDKHPHEFAIWATGLLRIHIRNPVQVAHPEGPHIQPLGNGDP